MKQKNKNRLFFTNQGVVALGQLRLRLTASRRVSLCICVSTLPRLIWSDGQRVYAAESQLISQNPSNDKNKQF